MHRGVYSVGHRVRSIEARWMAATLAGGTGAALSHRSAAALWGVLRDRGGPVEITRPTGWRAPAGVIAHRGSLPEDEVCIVDGIPITGISRTILDLAAVLSRRHLERALNEVEVRRLTDKLSVPGLLRRYPRRRGSVALRALLADEAATRGITRSDLEDLFLTILDGADLPRPRLNAHVSVHGRFLEVDCLWAQQRLAVELDGREVHRTGLAFETDRERDRLLLAEGWRVVRVTWRQLRYDSPAVLADLRALLRR